MVLLLYYLMVDKALLKALLHFWEKAVWAKESIIGAFAVIWALLDSHLVLNKGINFWFLMSKDWNEETELSKSWSNEAQLFKKLFVFGFKSFCSSL